jgi:putative flippase GtrA
MRQGSTRFVQNIPGVRLLVARFPSLLRFALVGSIAACAHFATFNLLLRETHVLVANTAAVTSAICVSYVLNARFTFRVLRSRLSFARYIVVALVGVAIHNSTVALLLTQLDSQDRLLANVATGLAVIPSATWNFLGFSGFAFRGATARGGGKRVASSPAPVSSSVGRDQ